MEILFETERLFMRQFDLSDAKDMFLLNNDPEVIKYTLDRAFKNIEEAEQFLQNYSSYRNSGYGRWVLLSKKTGKFIGWCGLRFNEEQMVDIGYRIFRSEWNKGYATESALKALQIGFDTYNLKEIIARADHNNSASIKVMEKIGMNYWKVIDTPHGPTIYYRKSNYTL